MCGIFGWSLSGDSKIDYNQRCAVAFHLASAMDRRGGDSWGALLAYRTNVDSKDGKKGKKAKENVVDVKRGLGTFVLGMNPGLLAQYPSVACHTRKKSVGEVSVKNAHPFEFGGLYGAHNGTLLNHEELNKQVKEVYGGQTDGFAVDSMHIFHRLAYPSEALKLEDIKGYGAVWWSFKNKPFSTFLTKWGGGDLSIWDVALYRGGQMTIWASTDFCIKEAVNSSLCAKKVKEIRVDERAIYRVENGVTYESGLPKWEAGFGRHKSWNSHSRVTCTVSGCLCAVREYDPQTNLERCTKLIFGHKDYTPGSASTQHQMGYSGNGGGSSPTTTKTIATCDHKDCTCTLKSNYEKTLVWDKMFKTLSCPGAMAKHPLKLRRNLGASNGGQEYGVQTYKCNGTCTCEENLAYDMSGRNLWCEKLVQGHPSYNHDLRVLGAYSPTPPYWDAQNQICFRRNDQTHDPAQNPGRYTRMMDKFLKDVVDEKPASTPVLWEDENSSEYGYSLPLPGEAEDISSPWGLAVSKNIASKETGKFLNQSHKQESYCEDINCRCGVFSHDTDSNVWVCEQLTPQGGDKYKKTLMDFHAVILEYLYLMDSTPRKEESETPPGGEEDKECDDTELEHAGRPASGMSRALGQHKKTGSLPEDEDPLWEGACC